jgi:general secretion pathway protein G
MRLRKFRRLTILPLTFIITFTVGSVCAVGYWVISTIPRYERAVTQAKEHSLRITLTETRERIRRYTEEKGVPPQSLEDLVKAGYVKRVPPDPVTERRDWILVRGTTPGSPPDVEGIIDVHSSSSGVSSEGTPYNAW